jgi:tellurite resistance protein
MDGQAARASRRSARKGTRLGLDEALIALFIGAMNANDHVAADEAARAHHLIWSTRRFRRKSGESVGKLIEDMRELVATSDPREVIERASKAIPARLRSSAFAVLVDLLLADGKLEATERRFLRELGSDLRLRPDTVESILDVVVTKNQL